MAWNPSRHIKDLGLVLVLIAVYFVSAKLGLRLAFVNASATAIWPPTGIAIASLLIFGYRFWPAIFIGAFLANITTTGGILSSLGIATGNTLEAVVAAYLINKYANGRNSFDSPRSIFKFTLFAGLVGPFIAASIGIISLLVGNFITRDSIGTVWLTWWLGDLAGGLIIAPFILKWSTNLPIEWSRTQFLEAPLLLILLIITDLIVFGNWSILGSKNYPIAFITIPPLIWTAFRFGKRETAVATLILSVIATWGTLHGTGPFVRNDQNESLLLLQAFIATANIMSITVAALVSQRKLAQKELLDSNSQISNILENITDAFIAYDKNWHFVYVNKQAAQILGKTQVELLGQINWEVFPESLQTAAGKKLMAAMDSQTPTHFEEYYSPFKKWFRVNIYPGETGLSMYFQDISQEKEIENIKDEFIAMASHELRTPLSAIKGLIAMVEQGHYGQLNEKLKKPINNVAISTERLINLTNDILDVSKIQSGKLKFEYQNISIKSLVEELISSMEPIAKENNTNLEISSPLPDKIVRIDPNKVRQILQNLIGNALKFTQKGTVSISSKLDGAIKILIKDNGIGISPDDQSKIFGKFQQLSPGYMNNLNGTGLGLFISRELAQKMGGEVKLENSKLGQGSTFSVSLPLLIPESRNQTSLKGQADVLS